MSGGHWDYIQYRFTDVADDIKQIIEKNGKEKTVDELRDGNWLNSPDYYERYPDEKLHYKYPDEVIEELKKGADIIAKAQIYMQRIDWLLSGDDGVESFLRRLRNDLDKLNNE